MSEQRIMILIAHQLNTIQNADSIVVLNEGRVIGQGKHQDLIMQNDFYKKLYESGGAF